MEQLTPLLESTCGLGSERLRIERNKPIKTTGWTSCPFLFTRKAKNSLWTLRFFGPSWKLSRSCTSAGRERGFQLLGSETLQSYWLEQRAAASPSSLASPTAAPALTRSHNEVNTMITIVFLDVMFLNTKTKERQNQKFGAYTGSFRCLLTIHWTVYFPLRMTHRLLRLQTI